MYSPYPVAPINTFYRSSYPSTSGKAGYSTTLPIPSMNVFPPANSSIPTSSSLTRVPPTYSQNASSPSSRYPQTTVIPQPSQNRISSPISMPSRPVQLTSPTSPPHPSQQHDRLQAQPVKSISTTVALPSTTPPSSATAHRPLSTPFYWPANKDVRYSDVQKLIQKHYIQEVTIEVDQDSPFSLVKADLRLKDQQEKTLYIPPDNLNGFIETLEGTGFDGIPYTIVPRKKDGQFMESLLTILGDLFVPLILIAGTGLSGVYGFQFYQNWRENQELNQHFKKALIPQKEPGTFPDANQLIKSLDPVDDGKIRQNMTEFLARTQDVLVNIGPPGTGKTHLTTALMQQFMNEHPDTLALNLGYGVGADVLENLEDMYSGDQVLAKKAQDNLANLNNGRPVKYLLTYVEEFEKAEQESLERLVVNAKGNPESKVAGNPEFLFVANANAMPGFLYNAAISNRSTFGLFQARQPETVARIFMEYLRQDDALTGQDLKPIKSEIQALFKEYPGISVRTVADTLSKNALHKLKQLPHQVGPTDVVAVTKEELEHYHLDQSEVASLIVMTLVDLIQSSRKPLKPEGRHDLYKMMYDTAIHEARQVGERNTMNGKQFHHMIQALAARQPLHTYTQNPDQVLTTAIRNIIKGFDGYRIQTLVADDFSNDPQLAAEIHLSEKFMRYLHHAMDTLRQDRAATVGDESHPEIQLLDQAWNAIQQAPRQSDMGQALSKAAQHYIEAKNDLPEEHQPTDGILEAIFQAVLNYNPETYTVENDFQVYAPDGDQTYVNVFKSLRKMFVLALNASSKQTTTLP